MRARRVSVTVVVLVSLLLGSGVGASVVLGGSPTLATPPTETAPTHRLVITAPNGSGSYTVTASGSLHLTSGEQNDYQLRGSRVSGAVGAGGDTKDVIRYTGYIESFQSEGKIRVTLDGQRIAPIVLAGQHIQLSRSNTSQSVDYQLSVTGQVAPGELAELADTATERRIRGHVRDTADSFYFTGEIANDSITVSGPVQIQINGQNASVFLTHEPPTATPTPTPTATLPPSPSSTPFVSSTGTPRSSSPTVTVTPSSPTSAHTHSPAAPSSSGSFGGQFVGGLVGGLLLIGVGAIVVLVLRR
jgi:hypothetical protein